MNASERDRADTAFLVGSRFGRDTALREAAADLLATGGPQDRDCATWLLARADRLARPAPDLPAWTACDGRPCRFCADPT